MNADRISKLYLRAETAAADDEHEMLLSSAARLELKHRKVLFHRQAFKDEMNALSSTVIVEC